MEHVLELYVREVGENDADTLQEEIQELPLQLWTGAATISTVQRETQM